MLKRTAPRSCASRQGRSSGCSALLCCLFSITLTIGHYLGIVGATHSDKKSLCRGKHLRQQRRWKWKVELDTKEGAATKNPKSSSRKPQSSKKLSNQLKWCSIILHCYGLLKGCLVHGSWEPFKHNLVCLSYDLKGTFNASLWHSRDMVARALGLEWLATWI